MSKTKDNEHTLGEVLGYVYVIGMVVLAVIAIVLNIKMFLSAM